MPGAHCCGVLPDGHRHPRSSGSRVRDLLVMLAEQVFTKVVLKITPDGMNVVGVVLRVIVFKKEGWALHSVIMRLALLNAAGPAKINFLNAGLFDFLNIFAGEVAAKALDITFDKPQQSITLAFGEVGA